MLESIQVCRANKYYFLTEQRNYNYFKLPGLKYTNTPPPPIARYLHSHMHIHVAHSVMLAYSAISMGHPHTLAADQLCRSSGFSFSSRYSNVSVSQKGQTQGSPAGGLRNCGYGLAHYSRRSPSMNTNRIGPRGVRAIVYNTRKLLGG